MLPNWLEILIGIAIGFLLLIGALVLYGHARQSDLEPHPTVIAEHAEDSQDEHFKSSANLIANPGSTK